jgi:hypothetical protein
MPGDGNCLFHGFFYDKQTNGVSKDSEWARAILTAKSANEIRLIIMKFIEANPQCTLGNKAMDDMTVEECIFNEVRFCVYMHACIATISHVFIYTFFNIFTSIYFIFSLSLINLFVALSFHNKMLPNFP